MPSIKLSEKLNEFSRPVHRGLMAALFIVASFGIMNRGEMHHQPGAEHPEARRVREELERMDDKRRVDGERERRNVQEQNNPNPAPPVMEEGVDLI